MNRRSHRSRGFRRRGKPVPREAFKRNENTPLRQKPEPKTREKPTAPYGAKMFYGIIAFVILVQIKTFVIVNAVRHTASVTMSTDWGMTPLAFFWIELVIVGGLVWATYVGLPLVRWLLGIALLIGLITQLLGTPMEIIHNGFNIFSVLNILETLGFVYCLYALFLSPSCTGFLSHQQKKRQKK